MMKSLRHSLFLSCLFAICAVLATPSQAQAQSCASPNLLLVLDNSCSMGGSKWSDATNAIKTITNSYKSKLTFGLEIFNSSASVVYGINNCFSAGNNCVPQLQTTLNRYSPGGGTNLKDAINKARTHLNGLSATLKKRKASVMFLTDGQASCANSEVAALQAALKVKTYVIGFGSGVDANCLNNMATSGGTALAGTRKYYQANNQNDLNKAMAAIANAATTEICNNNDDDCDGQIDEGLSKSCTGPCGKGTQVCKAGVWQTCSTARQPQPETCNNADDDCDGTIDENLKRACKTACGSGDETCSKGKWINCNAPKPTKETCNNKDDNCDGQIDNGVTRACKTACESGTETCVAGKWDFCTAKKPQPETCNNVDDNCDGSIDENLQRDCSSACGPGKEECKAGQWINCTGPQPQKEVCDGRDNDCNGQVDDQLTRACKSICGSGEEICQNGTWAACNAPKPKAEVCNGLDDDCNGKDDDVSGNDPKCPRCVNGVCLRGCTQECPKGFICEKGACIELPCRRIRCGSDETCRDGKCINVCQDVKCATGERCVNGSCVKEQGKDCTTLGCPNGQYCLNKQCVKDPCSGVTCQGREFCRDGQCVGSCANIKCDTGSYCQDGKCIENTDPCATIKCGKDQICFNGKCTDTNTHPCANTRCKSDQFCNPTDGKCVDDPCKHITCPGSSTCHRGQCYGGTNPKPDPPVFPEPPTDPENPGNGENNNTEQIGPDGGVVIPPTGTETIYTDGGSAGPDIPKGVRLQGMGCPCSSTPGQGPGGFPIALFLLVSVFLLGIKRRKQ